MAGTDTIDRREKRIKQEEMKKRKKEKAPERRRGQFTKLACGLISKKEELTS